MISIYSKQILSRYFSFHISFIFQLNEIQLNIKYSLILQVRSLAYDLVIAGQEVGGGSVRIHNSQLQKKVLDMLQISSLPLQHLINALESGCPPHAGIALGIR